MKLLFLVAILTPLIGCTYWNPPSNLEPLPANTITNQLTARFFGASTILISDGETSILIDGFFSRHSIIRNIITGMKTSEREIESYLKRNNIDDIDFILISHPHYDHILDSAHVAKVKCAKILCPEPQPNIDKIDTGLFSITFYKTPHAKKGRLLRLFEQAYVISSRGWKYHVDDDKRTYSFLISHPRGKILVVPSARYEPGMLTKPGAVAKADVVFLGIGLLAGQPEENHIENYWNEAVVKTEAKLVIPIHWDSLDSTPPESTPNQVDNIAKSIEAITKLKNKKSENPVIINYPPDSSDRFEIPFLKNHKQLDLEPGDALFDCTKDVKDPSFENA